MRPTHTFIKKYYTHHQYLFFFWYEEFFRSSTVVRLSVCLVIKQKVFPFGTTNVHGLKWTSGCFPARERHSFIFSRKSHRTLVIPPKCFDLVILARQRNGNKKWDKPLPDVVEKWCRGYTNGPVYYESLDQVFFEVW